MSALDGTWRTSTRSGDNGACVEVRFEGGAVEVRDSKDRGGPALMITPAAWRDLLSHLKSADHASGGFLTESWS